MLSTFLSSSEYSIEVKEKRIYPTAKKIYEKKCNKIDGFTTKEELESKIKKSCQNLKLKHIEYLSIYLWEKRVLNNLHNIKFIEIDKKEKCPICGMWVYKYPKWIAQIQTEKKTFSFDGVKDLMKYYFENVDDKANIIVRDYYSQKPIDARTSYFVLGSDVYGPMGEELIPFADYDKAQGYFMDHKGHKIVKFEDIQKDDLYK